LSMSMRLFMLQVVFYSMYEMHFVTSWKNKGHCTWQKRKLPIRPMSQWQHSQSSNEWL
jgi:hypothetical protein